MSAKYVIEFEEIYYPAGGSPDSPERLFRAKGFNTLVLDEEGLSKLKKLSDALNFDTYEQGFIAGRKSVLDDIYRMIRTESPSKPSEDLPESSEKPCDSETFLHFYGEDIFRADVDSLDIFKSDDSTLEIPDELRKFE